MNHAKAHKGSLLKHALTLSRRATSILLHHFLIAENRQGGTRLAAEIQCVSGMPAHGGLFRVLVVIDDIVGEAGSRHVGTDWMRATEASMMAMKFLRISGRTLRLPSRDVQAGFGIVC